MKLQTVDEVRGALRGAGEVTSLAALVRVAIADGREMLDREDVEPHYSDWLKQFPGEPCYACFAGAVMLGTLGFTVEEEPIEGRFFGPSDAPAPAPRALIALDAVRSGHVSAAYLELGLAPPPEERSDWLGALPGGDGVRSSRFTGRGEFADFLDAMEALANRLEAFETEC